MSDFIAHYGIKGMKWGVRKDRSSSSGRTTIKAKRTAKAKTFFKHPQHVKTVDKNGSRTAARLSDSELKRRSKRIEAEQQYARLTKPKDSSLVSFGKKAVSGAAMAIAVSQIQKRATPSIDRIVDQGQRLVRLYFRS